MKVVQNATNKKRKRSQMKIQFRTTYYYNKIVACDVMFCEEKMSLTICNKMLWKKDVNDNEQNNATTKHLKIICRWQNAKQASEASKKLKVRNSKWARNKKIESKQAQNTRG
jgi:hypothetical protein